MQPYAEMKAAGSHWMGDVPAHWTVSRFRYEAAINGGQVDPREEPWSGMTLIAPNHLESGTGRIIGVETAEGQGADSGKYLVEAGQIVYSKIRPALNKVAIAETEALCSADMYAMSFRDRVHPRFAFYYFLARPFHTFATVTSMRVKMPKVNREELAEAPWLVPPLEEQRAIANYLDRETARIDTLIEEQQRLIEMLRERRSAAVRSAIAEAGALGPTDKLGRRTKIGNGSTPRRENAAYWSENGFPWLNSSVVNRDQVSGADQFVTSTALKECHLPIVPPGSVLVGLTGQGKTRGMATRLVVEATVNQHVAYVTPEPAFWAPEFLMWLLRASYEQLRMLSDENGSTKGGLTCADLKAFRVSRPPLDEQRRIAAYLEEQTTKIDQLIVETERFIELSKERRAALITAAVTGQIDVRDEVA
ncbi:restriction endonuclease subunit S [Nocardioides sp. NPDC006273]|uniref:restriction endonuclease subunit S n=1 Tax=Nocardioides sp. NPDC006273 TaxID=3155598 RepID=UPI0033A1868B